MESALSGKDPILDLYDVSYRHFADQVYTEIRQETYGDDFGQTSWHTAEEQDRLAALLQLRRGLRVLDIACGSGGPALRLAALFGCSVIGIDIQAEGVANARRLTAERRLTDLARFEQVDASQALPFAEHSFDAILCIDAINHLPDRAATLRDWQRVLAPGGRLAFTNPAVLTGPISNMELAARSSIGFFLFTPQRWDEQMLGEAGLELLLAEDSTPPVAGIAARWHAARERRAGDLGWIEGEQRYSRQQEFLRVTTLLAAERRLSRSLILARRRAT
jgi:SAM-dependent methyltransferase